jgi:hypothetical protein
MMAGIYQTINTVFFHNLEINNLYTEEEGIRFDSRHCQIF